ncbi:MAG: hypothetical protein JF616_06240 [Fibrobacteres bacterium]|jgi:hypothetical protein|nr:hypothetical protein [Fibrobacterota bacterium]
MKIQYLVFRLFASISMLASVAVAGSPSSGVTDSCGPTFLEIYDFQVDDVFQVTEMHGSNGNGSSSTATEEKYRIVSREAIAGGFRYGIEERTRVSYYSASPYGGPAITSTGYGNINGIWEITDSTARRALNTCKDRVAKLPTSGSQFAGTDGQYSGLSGNNEFTRVRITVGDRGSFPLADSATRLKIFGAPQGAATRNLYTDSVLKVASSGQEWAVYAPGLGLVRMTAMVFESQIEYQLQGYSRGGVTVGTVYPDSVFIMPVALRLKTPENLEIPDIVRLTRNGPSFLSMGSAGIRDLIGRQIRSFPSQGLP